MKPMTEKRPTALRQKIASIGSGGAFYHGASSALVPAVSKYARKTNPVNNYEFGGLMKGFIQDIERLTIANDAFRQVIYTAQNCQLVLMSLKPLGEIGAEVHTLDQFFRVEEGTGEAVLDGVRTVIRPGFAIVVPAGAEHNIINTGDVMLKLYTIYAPPNHRDGVVHHTRAEAEADNEHFDGKTTE